MYLKSLTVENYRKFRNSKNVLEIIHKKNEETNPNVAENTTLIVGRNNTGKTTLIDLLQRLSNMKTGSTTLGVHDFNLNYLQRWFEDNIIDSNLEQNTPLPVIKFQLEIGIDDLENNSLANFENILILENIYPLNDGTEFSEQNEIQFKIDIEYKCQEQTKVIQLIRDLKQDYEENKIETPGTDDLDEFEDCNTLKEYIEYIKYNRKDNSDKNLDAIYKYVDYCDKKLFKKFLEIIDNASYKLLFYPEGSDEVAENFSLSNLLEVKVVKANNINGDDNLSSAYNKIIETFIQNMDESEQEKIDLRKLLDKMNYDTKKLIDGYYTEDLNEVIQKIESSKKLEMNLMSDITMKQILRNSIKYEYMENNNFIPENQFGLGYTNLMIIIAELVEYIDFYKEENYTDKINIICIEEPETYMHPQMQEMFIGNIENAIDSLYQNKTEKFNESKFNINYQLIISTHSSHILNSKIHSGNTFDNINYLSKSENTSNETSKAKIIPLSDNLIISNAKELSNPNINEKDLDLLNSLTFIKKHMRIETSSLLFADAVIIVEGPTEEAYLKYILSDHEILSKFYITVLSIGGAYGKVYYSLIEKLGIPCIIYTDIDYKRKKEDGKNKKQCQIDQWPNSKSEGDIIEQEFTTNDTLKYFVSLLMKNNTEKEEFLQSKEAGKIAEILRNYNSPWGENTECEEYLKYTIHNIDILTQGKINCYYASSLEEAIILENFNSEHLNSILEQTLPGIYKDLVGHNDKINYYKLKENSFKFQTKIGTNQKKTKFMNNIIYEDIVNKAGTDKENYTGLNLPQYLEIGLKILEQKLNGEQ